MDPAALKLAAQAARALAEKTQEQRKARAETLLVADRIIKDEHPKARSAIMDPRRQVATVGTRRAAKSRPWTRRMVYDAVLIPDSLQIYVNTTLEECKRIVWRGTGRDGLLSLNDDFSLGGIPRRVDVAMDFPNGSRIELFGADDERAILKLLGGAFLRLWVDEAQKLRFLAMLIQKVGQAALADFDGQIVLTGTPGKIPQGLFYDITKDGSPLAGDDEHSWAVHRYSVVDNPKYGATPEERWDRTAGRALLVNKWTRDEPDFVREWLGRWVLADAHFVYDVHKVPPAELCYAPHRIVTDGDQVVDCFADDGSFEWWRAKGFPDLQASLDDLPGWPDKQPEGDWLFAFGGDLGYRPDPFAFVVWAFSISHPDGLELCSWKMAELTADQQIAIMIALHAALAFSVMVADAAGGGKSVVKGWQDGWLDRAPIPIEEAKKNDKATHMEFLNSDIRGGRLKFREGSPLLEEAKVLTWRILPTGKRIEDVQRDGDGVKTKGNDCLDAGLYSHRHMSHHRFKEPTPEPRYGTPEHYRAEMAELEADIVEDIERRQEAGWR